MILRTNEIHLWFAFPDEITDTSLLSRYMNLLSLEERNKQKRFLFPEHQHQYLVAHALVRTTLSKYTGVHPRDFEFLPNNYGRPEIINKEITNSLRFNLSHTSGLIACAVVLKKDIGVDVEKMDSRRADLKCIDHFLSPQEVAEIHQIQGKRKIERFFDYWTLKESYIKARGIGLSIPLDRFSFSVSDHQPLGISFHPELADNPNHWQFLLLEPTPKYRAALSVCSDDRSGFQISIRKVVPLCDENAFSCLLINQSV